MLLRKSEGSYRKNEKIRLVQACNGNNVDTIPWAGSIPGTRCTLKTRYNRSDGEIRWKRTSFPAAIVITFPVAAILLATTALDDSVQPSAPPSDKVIMSWPSLTPRRRASIITTTHDFMGFFDKLDSIWADHHQ